MKILILTEGGKNIGFGHVARCSALYEAFEENGIVPEFIINGDDTIKDLVKGKRYKIINWLKEGSKPSSLKKFDVVVLDSYLAPLDFYKMVSKTVPVPVYIDDTKRLRYPRGIVLNGALGAEDIAYPRDLGTTYLLGSKYALLRKEFWKSPVKKISRNINSVLMIFGGDDARNMTPKLLKFLSDNAPSIRKKVVIGKAYTNIKEIESLKDDLTDIVYYPSARGVKRVMAKSDIAISAGGQALYELARMGVPTIVVATANNQRSNIKGLAGEKFIEYAGWWRDAKTINRIKILLEKLKGSDIRKRKRDIGRKLIDGKAGQRIFKYLMGRK